MPSRGNVLPALALLILLTAATARAVVDPDPDGIGVYFDTAADQNSLIATPLVPFDAYVILTNPTAAEVRSFEFAYSVRPPAGMEAQLVRTGLFLPPGIICIDCDWDPYADNVILSFPSPQPPAPAVVLMSWQYMLLVSMPVEFYLSATPFMGPMNGQLAYEGEAGFVPLHVSSGDPALPVAGVNTGPIIPARRMPFGDVKARYR